MPVGAPIGRSFGPIPMATPSHQNVSDGLSINSKDDDGEEPERTTTGSKRRRRVPLLTNPILLLLGTVAVPLHPMQTHVPLPLLNPRTLQMPCCPSKHPHYGLPWRSTSRRRSGAPQPSLGPPVQKTGHYGRRLLLSLQFRSFLIHSSKEEILDLSTMQTCLGRKILCLRGGRFSRHETKSKLGPASPYGI